VVCERQGEISWIFQPGSDHEEKPQAPGRTSSIRPRQAEDLPGLPVLPGPVFNRTIYSKLALFCKRFEI
jgi:hypothetical protein